MTIIDTEFILIAIGLMAPIYAYLHKMSLTLSKFTDVVENCKTCTKSRLVPIDSRDL